jgi:hypothetical protein
MALTKGLEALALHIQEAQGAMGHGEVRDKLSSAIRSAHADSGKWAHYVDHTGDGSKGDVIYECEGDMRSCPYSMGEIGGKHTANIDTASAKKVMPSVSYQPVADDIDQYTTMEAANLYTKGPVPLCERFISKDERDKADAGDFAGKGKSFPILKPEDVGAAVHSMGRAGSDNHSANTLKKNIIAIAKRKGYTSSLPKEWQGEEDLGMRPFPEAKVIEITGDCVALREGAVGQDGTAYLKLIQPGWGSSGYYPAAVLERDGPRVFKNGLKNFWNHQTSAEEAARPEGDLRDLASVLTENAHYERNGPAGEGLYAKAKIFEMFKQPVDDLAKHIGVSIRASGKAKQGQAPDGKKGTIIESLDSALSADYVTTPGAGGQILQLFEAARKRPAEGETEMTEAVERQLRETLQTQASELRKLKERGARLDAADVISDYFTTIRVGEAVQKEVAKTLLERVIPMTTAGDLDKEALKKLAEAETVRELEFIERATGHKIVRNLGTSSAEPSKKELKEQRKREEAHSNTLANLIGVPGERGRQIMREGRAAFDPMYNAGERNNGKLTVGTEAN